MWLAIARYFTHLQWGSSNCGNWDFTGPRQVPMECWVSYSFLECLPMNSYLSTICKTAFTQGSRTSRFLNITISTKARDTTCIRILKVDSEVTQRQISFCFLSPHTWEPCPQFWLNLSLESFQFYAGLSAQGIFHNPKSFKLQPIGNQPRKHIPFLGHHNEGTLSINFYSFLEWNMNL